jgi:uncharacterized protein
MEVPYQQLAPATLENIIVDFVTREGTDVGHTEIPLAQKIEDIHRALREGKVILDYDDVSESCTILPV